MRQTWMGALAVALVAATASAQDAKPGARIAVIDMGEVSQKSLMGKGYAGQIDQLRNEIEAQTTKLQNDIQKMDAQIKTLQEELEKQASVLSPEAADRKQQDIVKKGREREAAVQDGRAELQRMNQRAQEKAAALNNEFQGKIKPIIEAVAKEKGIDIVLNSEVAYTVNKAYDMSQDVIVKADEADRAARAARPAAAPAAAAPKPAASPRS